MKLGIIIFTFIFFISCNIFDLKPLDVQEINNGSISVRWFHTSDITTVHNHVEIKGRNGWNQVMEADGNGYKIYDVLINKDTVIVQGYKDMLIYQLTSNFWGVNIKFDNTITLYEYMKKFNPADAKYYKDRFD